MGTFCGNIALKILVELETDEILGSMESQESRLGQSASKEVSRMTDSTTPKDEGTSLPCTKNVLHIDQQQEDFDRETGMPGQVHYKLRSNVFPSLRVLFKLQKFS